MVSPLLNAPATSIKLELLRLLARQDVLGPIPVFISMGIIAAFVAGKLSPWYWGAWLAWVALVLVGRSLLLARLPEMDYLSEKLRLRIAVMLSALNGVSHGISLLFFPLLTDMQQAVVSMILMGISSISVVTAAGYMPISIAYIAPTLMPMALLWAFNPNVEGWIGVSIAVMTLFFCPVMVVLAGSSFKMFQESFEIRKRQVALNLQLQEALDQAEAASRAKTRFLASASHDLRQPIHALSLFCGALAKRPLDDASREIAKHMDISLQALASQLDSLLDISKLDAGVVQVNDQVFNLRLLAERLQEEFMPAARSKGLSVWLDCPVDAHVKTDEVLLERIARNLLSNAIKYTEIGKVELALEIEAGNAILTIADTGRGIPEAEQVRVFEEFYQLDNPERDRSKGLGLGLAIVRRLVDLLTVQFDMESTAGGGTVISLTMPVVEPVSCRKSEQAAATLSWEHLCALVVDDEVEVGLGMKALLESMHCRVLLADGTEAALAAINRVRPDIILVDFRLRGTDNGITTVREARKVLPGIPAILISGDTAPDRLREAEEAGIELLHKPVLAGELEQAIAHACGLTEHENRVVAKREHK
ncbi:response regulator [Exilibacterium tricleocarpae]|uniref:histidine kinase n=1 Tax=Exilibacterium tricleocarpae TaxID=2591008 RepID=A0A545T0L4_9GAMM|nr:hybrid sensor histidine kinase/response regulator [Exilibacterium tricleocarpae]TQV70740.1 response regulator [Exilibacterium tricleocarpae]